MKISTICTTSSSPATITSPWKNSPEKYQEILRTLLASHVSRLKLATGLTLDQIARERLGWSRGNNFTQLTNSKYKSVLSPASAVKMAEALELNKEETDELMITVMRANSNRNCEISPDFIARYEKALVRRLCIVIKNRSIRLS